MTSQELKKEYKKAAKLLEHLGYYRDYTDNIAEYNGKIWLSHSVFPNDRETPPNLQIVTGLTIGKRYNDAIDTIIVSPNEKTIRAILAGTYRY